MRQNIRKILDIVSSPDLKSKLVKMYDHYEKSMCYYPASRKGHHDKLGDYSVHIGEVMTIGCQLYKMMSEYKSLNFTMDDVIVVAFLHDIPKLFRYEEEKRQWHKKNVSPWKIREDIPGYDDSSKTAVMAAQFGLILSDQQLEAISLHHGGWSEGMSSVYSVRPHMGHLATLLHCADLLSGFILGQSSPT